MSPKEPIGVSLERILTECAHMQQAAILGNQLSLKLAMMEGIFRTSEVTLTSRERICLVAEARSLVKEAKILDASGLIRTQFSEQSYERIERIISYFEERSMKELSRKKARGDADQDIVELCQMEFMKAIPALSKVRFFWKGQTFMLDGLQFYPNGGGRTPLILDEIGHGELCYSSETGSKRLYVLLGPDKYAIVSAVRFPAFYAEPLTNMDRIADMLEMKDGDVIPLQREE